MASIVILNMSESTDSLEVINLPQWPDNVWSDMERALAGFEIAAIQNETAETLLAADSRLSRRALLGLGLGLGLAALTGCKTVPGDLRRPDFSHFSPEQQGGLAELREILENLTQLIDGTFNKYMNKDLSAFNLSEMEVVEVDMTNFAKNFRGLMTRYAVLLTSLREKFPQSDFIAATTEVENEYGTDMLKRLKQAFEKVKKEALAAYGKYFEEADDASFPSILKENRYVFAFFSAEWHESNHEAVPPLAKFAKSHEGTVKAVKVVLQDREKHEVNAGIASFLALGQIPVDTFPLFVVIIDGVPYFGASGKSYNSGQLNFIFEKLLEDSLKMKLRKSPKQPRYQFPAGKTIKA